MYPITSLMLSIALSLGSFIANAEEAAGKVPDTLTAEEKAAVAPPPMLSEDGEIDWLALLPPDEIKMFEDMASAPMSHFGSGPANSFTSERVVEAMDGVKGKIGGYIVPLSVDEKGRMIDMFLVPYFGACIHMPPPPPNQIVYIKPEEPMPMTEIWDAYWVHGTLRTARQKNRVATAAYTLEVERFELIQ